MKVILKREYSDESMYDLSEDIYEAIQDANLPKDEYEFIKGMFTVTIEWRE